MGQRRIYRQRLCILLAVSLIFIVGFLFNRLQNSIPDYVRIEEGNSYPKFLSDIIDRSLEKTAIQTTSSDTGEIPKENLRLDFTEDASLSGDEKGSYIVEYKLFGLLNIKSVEVDVVGKQSLVPCGFPVGIYVETEGVMVIGTGKVTGIDGLESSPAENILMSGDYILSINGEAVTAKEQFVEKLNQYGDQDVILKIRRNKEELQVKLTPVRTGQKEYKLGVWIRDNTQGVGMLTYVDEEGKFGALGHGINDSDTGLLMEINNGKLLKTDILSIVKGQKGSPGELVGVIDYREENVKGRIEKNTSCGIFGHMYEDFAVEMNQQAIPVAMKQDITKGAAQILSGIDGSIKAYDIQILEVNMSEKNRNKGLVIEVTDAELLNKTGGIVQGMSGSPIIQDGKLIGAVTHVFVQDSTRGYGIFIENMLAAEE